MNGTQEEVNAILEEDDETGEFDDTLRRRLTMAENYSRGTKRANEENRGPQAASKSFVMGTGARMKVRPLMEESANCAGDSKRRKTSTSNSISRCYSQPNNVVLHNRIASKVRNARESGKLLPSQPQQLPLVSAPGKDRTIRALLFGKKRLSDVRCSGSGPTSRTLGTIARLVARRKNCATRPIPRRKDDSDSMADLKNNSSSGLSPLHSCSRTQGPQCAPLPAIAQRRRSTMAAREGKKRARRVDKMNTTLCGGKVAALARAELSARRDMSRTVAGDAARSLLRSGRDIREDMHVREGESVRLMATLLASVEKMLPLRLAVGRVVMFQVPELEPELEVFPSLLGR